MSEAYWDKLALEATKPKIKTINLGKNWLAIYTDTRVGSLLVDAITKYWKDNGGYLLDVGCGSGKWTNLFAQSFSQLRTIGIDLSREMLKLAKMQSSKENTHLTRMNIAKLALPNNRFDVVTSVTVLQHISDHETWRTAVKEIVRVTRPQGHVIIYDAFLPIGRFRVKKLREYVSYFKAAGAKLIHWEGADPSYPIKVGGLIEYGRSFSQEKVYYFKNFPKFSSKFSQILATVAYVLDVYVGKTILGMMAPHKIIVFKKEK